MEINLKQSFRVVLVAVLMTICFLATTTTMAFQWGAFVAFGVGGLVFGMTSFPRRAFSKTQWWCYLSVLLLGSYCLLRAIVSPVEELATRDIAMILFALGVYSVFLGHPRLGLLAVGVIVVLALGNVAMSLLQQGVEKTLSIYSFLGSYSREGHLERPSGFFFNANHAAGFLGCCALMVLSLVVFGRGGAYWRLIGGFVVFLCLLGIVLTQSRSGSAGLFLGVCCIGAISLRFLFAQSRLRGRGMMILIAIIVVSLGGLAFAVWEVAKVRGGKYGAAKAIAEDARISLWKGAAKQFKHSPWIGTGAGSYEYYELRGRPNIPWHLVSRRGVYAHNEFLQLMAEYGSIALGLLFLVLTVHAWAFLREMLGFLRRLHSRWPVSLPLGLYVGAASGVVTLSGLAFFEFLFRVPAILACMAMCLALVGSGLRKDGERQFVVFGKLKLNWFLYLTIGGSSFCLMVLGYRNGVSDVADAVAQSHLSNENSLLALNAAKFSSDWDKQSASGRALAGKAYLELGNEATFEVVKQSFFRKAIASYDEALVLYPQGIEYLLVLTRLYARTGDVDHALELWKRAFEWAPIWNDTHRAHVDALVYGDRREEALEACDFWHETNTSVLGKAFKVKLKRDFANLPKVDQP